MNATVLIDLNIMGLGRIRSVYSLNDGEIILALKRVDLPSVDASIFERMLCTDAAAIKIIKIKRKALAEKISTLLTESIMLQLEEKDTMMGYPVNLT